MCIRDRVYIAFRFEWIYGVAAVIACLHDTIITIGLFSLFNKEITLTVIAALLTLVGYSMNDTIVIFDRIRENIKLLRREPLESLINKSAVSYTHLDVYKRQLYYRVDILNICEPYAPRRLKSSSLPTWS